LIYSLPVTSYNIPNSHSEQLDFVNIDSLRQAETIGLLTAIFDVQLPVKSYSIYSSPMGLRYLENIGIAAGMLLLSCLQIEIYVFPDWWPLS